MSRGPLGTRYNRALIGHYFIRLPGTHPVRKSARMLPPSQSHEVMLEPLPHFRTNLLEPQEGFEPPMIPAYKAGAVGHCATGA